MSTNGSTAGAGASDGGRLDFIDVHRGLAVVLMIWMHSADAWLRPALKTGWRWDEPWNLIRSAGGLAAPTFLMLAGTSGGIALWRVARTAGAAGGVRAGLGSRAAADTAREHVARGLQLVVLGYALRLQMWLIDAGGARLGLGWLTAIVLGGGYLAAYRGIARAGSRERAQPARGLLLGAAVALPLGFALAGRIEQPPAWALVRVEVLQASGASLMVVGALYRPLLRVPWLGVALGVIVALATHYVRELVPGSLPVPIAAYLAQWPPPAGRSFASLFPLFPWLAYALAGVSLGQWLAWGAARGQATRAALIAVLVGVPLAVLACEPLPFAKALVAALPQCLHLVRVVYRVGASLLLLGIAMLFTRPRAPFAAGLRTLGQASLFVYWAHLQLTFGVLAKPLARSLDFSAWAFGFALLSVLMALLAGWWVPLRSRLRRRAVVVRSQSLPSSQADRAGA